MRDVNKAIQDYKKKFMYGDSNKGKFYVTDYYQVNEISKGDKYNCIDNALMLGFMVGYRLGKTESRNKQKHAKACSM